MTESRRPPPPSPTHPLALLSHGHALLSHGPRPRLLLSAVRHSSVEALAKLKEHGVDINQRHWNGNTALHEAARSGEKTIVDWLLRNGGDIDALNNSGAPRCSRDAAEIRDAAEVQPRCSRGAAEVQPSARGTHLHEELRSRRAAAARGSPRRPL